MAMKERIREPINRLVRPEYLAERFNAGWRLVGLEWERETAEFAPYSREEWAEEVPYGLRISEDCRQLVANPFETEVIVNALDLIVEDCPLSVVANRLNQQGYRTRDGREWTPTALFDLLPRMIQVGPRLLNSKEWMTRRARLPKPNV
jgi:hypothetical protein